jgi:hypothetical protein
VSVRRRRILIATGTVLGLLLAAIGILFLYLRHPIPEGEAGPAADALARSIEKAVHRDAWDRTGAVRWTFRGKNQHLWDRQRQLARVRWGGREVLVDLQSRGGHAFRDGVEVLGPEKEELLSTAYGYWVNDSFWLAAVYKLFDPGVARTKASLEQGEEGLLLTYRLGGLTPGDRYLWIVGREGRPRAWRMWVSILPVGGIEFSIDEWTPLGTGALIPTRHSVLGLALRLTDVAGAQTLGELEPGVDPFARILAGAVR